MKRNRKAVKWVGGTDMPTRKADASVAAERRGHKLTGWNVNVGGGGHHQGQCACGATVWISPAWNGATTGRALMENCPLPKAR